MKMLIIFFISLMTVGCMQEPKLIYSIDSEFAPHLEVFKAEAQQRGIPMNINNLVMRFTKAFDKSETLAQCQYGTTPTILVGLDFWNYSDPKTREQVIFHELGHCILGRGHLDDSVNLGGYNIIPKSIMSTLLFSTTYYDHNRTYYIDELFAGR